MIMRWRRGSRQHSVLAISALTVLAVCASPALAVEPSRPTDDTTILAKVPPHRDQAAARLRAEQTALSSDRSNLTLALSTARSAIEDGRSNADPRRYGQAQAALAPWWDQAEPPEEVRVLRAVISQAFHDFPAALADLDAILARSPDNAQARLSRAFVRMVTGDIEGAAGDCGALPERLSPIIAIVCTARADALSGKADEAYERLSRILTLGAGQQASMRQFAVAVLADMSAARGRQDDANRFFTEALREEKPDVSLIAAYADLLLDSGRPAEALSLLDGKGDADILILRRAIAGRKLGDPRLAQWSAVLNERFAAAAAGGVRVHLREEARFRLEVEGNAAGALSLAAANWKVQKEPPDARLLLECAIAAHMPSSARPALDFIERTGLRDARLTPFLVQLGKIN